MQYEELNYKEISVILFIIYEIERNFRKYLITWQKE